jgi:hypothetical protein
LQLAERLPKRPNSCLTLANTKKWLFVFFSHETLAKTTLWSWNACQYQTFSGNVIFQSELLERLPKSNFWFGTLAK